MKKAFALRLSRKHFAMPYVVFMTLFIVLPLVLLLVNAFIDHLDGTFTLRNFAKFFTEDYGARNFGKSMLIGLATTVICFVLGYPVAYILSNPKYNRSTVLIMLFVLPMWINFLLRTLAAKELFKMMDWGFGYGAVLFGMVYDFLPFMVLPIYTTLTNIDKSLIEAAQDLGATPNRVFLKVIFPLSTPGIVSGVMMVFMPTISTFVISEMMSNGKIMLFGNFIDSFFHSHNYGMGSALSIILLLIIGLSVLVSKRFDKNPQKGGAGLW